MIHELRTCGLDEALAPEYFGLLREMAMPIRGDAFGRLPGNWTIPGRRITFHHPWEYESLGERTLKRPQLAALDRWRLGFLPAAAQCIASQRIAILQPQGTGRRGGEHDAPPRLTTLRCRPGAAPAVAAAIAAANHRPGCVWIEEMPDPNAVRCLAPTSESAAVEARFDMPGVIGMSHETLHAGPYRR